MKIANPYAMYEPTEQSPEAFEAEPKVGPVPSPENVKIYKYMYIYMWTSETNLFHFVSKKVPIT